MLAIKEKNFISAVIYIYNNEACIYPFLRILDQTLSSRFDTYEIICVNDASTDNSIKEIERFSHISSGNVISILNMSFFQGLELSMNAGVDLAIGDFVYEFDSPSDTFDPKLIVQIYEQSLKGYDIISAAPEHGRRFISKIFYSIFNHYASTQYLIRTESFRILSRRGINRIHSISSSMFYRKAVYANCGLKTDVIFYKSTDKIPKPDHATQRKQKEIASDAIILYTDIAYRLSISFTFAMVLFTVFIGMYTSYIYWSGRPVAGWTTTMLFLSFSFLGVFSILAVVIKYMTLILHLNFTKQKYIIESIEKLNLERKNP